MTIIDRIKLKAALFVFRVYMKIFRRKLWKP